jgi:hypothetical protein
VYERKSPSSSSAGEVEEVSSNMERPEKIKLVIAALIILLTMVDDLKRAIRLRNSMGKHSRLSFRSTDQKMNVSLRSRE